MSLATSGADWPSHAVRLSPHTGSNPPLAKVRTASTTPSPLGVGQTTDHESDERRPAMRAGLTVERHHGWAVVLVVAIACVAAAGIWWFDRLSSEWGMVLGLGSGLLAVAAVPGGLFFRSSRRAPAEAHQQLAETAGAHD